MKPMASLVALDMYLSLHIALFARTRESLLGKGEQGSRGREVSHRLTVSSLQDCMTRNQNRSDGCFTFLVRDKAKRLMHDGWLV